MTIPTSTQARPPLNGGPAFEPIEHRRFMTWAGWSGLVASVAYITTIAATSLFGSVEPSDGPNDAIRYLQDIGDNAIRSYTYGIAGIVMSLLFIPYGVAVYSKLHWGAAAAFGRQCAHPLPGPGGHVAQRRGFAGVLHRPGPPPAPRLSR